jgi:hypothetical protein
MICLLLILSVAYGQTTLGAYNAAVSACVGANNAAVQGGLCYRLRYPVGSVPAGGVQGLFALSSGLAQNNAGDVKIPYAAIAGAKWINANSATAPDFRFAGAGLVWLYAGTGIYCDRDANAGFTDPSPNAGSDTLCYTAASKATPNEDCILGFVRAGQSNFNPVNITTTSNLHSVGITEQSGIYNQNCYVKASTNTASDPTVPGSGGRTVGEWRAKCDIAIRNINNPFVVADYSASPSTTRFRVWDLFSNANLTTWGVNNCDADTKQRVGIQVSGICFVCLSGFHSSFSIKIWVIAAGAVGVAGTVPTQTARGGDDAIRLNSLNNLTYSRTVTCVYDDSSSVQGTVSADRKVAATFANAALLPASFSGASLGIVRINFGFSCARTVGGTNRLVEVRWDPDFEADQSNAPVSPAPASASSLSVSIVLMLLAIALFL